MGDNVIEMLKTCDSEDSMYSNTAVHKMEKLKESGFPKQQFIEADMPKYHGMGICNFQIP
jgi:hypothetical protein